MNLPSFRLFLGCIAALLGTWTLRGAPAPSSPDEPLSAKEMAQGFRERALLALPRAEYRASVDAAEQREGRRLRKKFSRLRDLRVLEPATGETVTDAIARLKASGRYEFVEPDYLRHATITPNDPRLGEQWSLSNNGSNNGIAGLDIAAPTAWDTQREATSVIVAVIDSGVRLTHEDIAANLWRNPGEIPGNNRDDDGNGYIDDVHGINAALFPGTAAAGDPSDDNGHGSHVAGTIGAVGNNSLGVSGVAWRVQIMPLKFLRANGSGPISDAIECIDYAIAKGAHIINASYGGETAQSFTEAERSAIVRAREAGIIFVAAAGNDGTNLDVAPHYPASYGLENVLAIGNSGRRDEVSPSSNFGATVELFAPGTEILSLSHTSDSAYISRNGTSMAAPHVSGALALLKARFPGDTPRQLINRLLRHADPVAAFVGRAQTARRLNLARALVSTDNRPFNDDFASRARLNGANIDLRSSNTGATLEPGEPNHGTPSEASLWWEWTAPASATVSVSTTGSGFDTVLAVYTGSAIGGLSPVAANDDDAGAPTSRVIFAAQAGVAYQIAVAGRNNTAGFVRVSLGTTPANDLFAAATVLTGRRATATGTNKNTSRESGEPRILNYPGGTSLWYRWTAPASGRFQFSVTSPDLDPLLAVYTGNALDSLTLVGASDDTQGDTSALVTVEAAAGTTYHISVDAENALGEFTLTLNDSLWQAAATDSITGTPAVAADGTVYVGSLDRLLYAFAPDGGRKWTFTTTGTIDTASPAVADDGTVLVGSNDGKLYAINPNGTQKWQRDFGPTSFASNSPAIAADGTIYIRIADGFLYALDPATGADRWRYNINSTLSSFYGSPVVGGDGTVYQPSSDSKLYALNPSGTLKWTFTADNEIYTPPAIDAAGNLYFITLTGGVYSVRPDGTQRWRTSSGGNCTSTPALSGDGATLYYGGYDQKLYALDTSDGLVRWSHVLGNEVRASSPAVDANGVIYLGCYDGKIYAVQPNGALKHTWETGRFIRSSPAIAGTTLYIGSNDHKLYAFDLGVGPAGGPWPQYRHNSRRLGRAISETLTITAQPQSQTVAVGGTATLRVIATGSGLTYQWFKDGVAIPGATSATLTLSNVTAANNGSYAVVVSSSQGALTSASAVILVEAPRLGRLVNLSVRAVAGSGSQTLIVGFAVSQAVKPLVIRGIGPTLALPAYGVTGALADPQLSVSPLGSTTVLATNDNWGGSEALATAFGRVGGFALDAASKDAALLLGVAPGSYTAQIISVTGASGVALAEVYDDDPTPAGAETSETGRLVNLSARAQVGTGGDLLIAGFAISGNVPKQVLIRATGPALVGYGVTGVLADPRLDLFPAGASSALSSNDNWGGTSELVAAAARVNAFPIDNTASSDSALLITLTPGSYTAQVRGVAETTGVALVEVYEMPE